jgi:hypothetical protein
VEGSAPPRDYIVTQWGCQLATQQQPRFDPEIPMRNHCTANFPAGMLRAEFK